MRSEPRFLPRLFPVLLLPALASCAFLLDFDELQTEQAKGSGGSAGTDGKGGSGGSTDCPSECFDDDPCTLDGCSDEGACLDEPVLGLVLDGVDETIPADAHYRTAVASAADAFFLSSFSLVAGVPEVTFYRLDANAPTGALSTVATLGGLNLGDATPLSTAGLAVDTALGRIHAFLGMRNDTNLEQRLWHVVLDMNYEVNSRTVIPGGYGSQLPFNYPVAANFGGDIAAAWIDANQGVSLWTGALSGPTELALGQAPMSVALLASSENDPLVLYGVGGGGVFVEGNGVAATAVDECQMRPGGYASSSATALGVPGFWLAYWTKFGEATGGEPGYLTTDGRGLACSPAGCITAVQGECSQALENGIRNVALASAVRPGDPTGLVHVVQVTPFIRVEAGTTEPYAGVVAAASRVDFGRVPFEGEAETTELGEEIVLSSMPTAVPDLAGPDWPTVAYVPPDRFAITWIQPSPVAGSELRIQRYRLCAD